MLSKEVSSARIASVFTERLKWLLNTRRLGLNMLDSQSNEGSLPYYGLPSFNHLNWNDKQDQALLKQSIEETICRCEPDLSEVKVMFVDQKDDHPGFIKIELSASLKKIDLKIISELYTWRQEMFFSKVDYG